MTAKIPSSSSSTEETVERWVTPLEFFKDQGVRINKARLAELFRHLREWGVENDVDPFIGSSPKVLNAYPQSVLAKALTLVIQAEDNE